MFPHFPFPVPVSRSTSFPFVPCYSLPLPFTVPRCSFPILHSPFHVPRSKFPVPRFPFPKPRSQFPVRLSTFTVLHSLFSISYSPVLNSPCPIPHSLFLLPPLPFPSLLIKSINNTRRNIYLFCSKIKAIAGTFAPPAGYFAF